MLHRIFPLLAMLAPLAASAVGTEWAMPSDSLLRQWAAKMLMVGFKGDTIAPGSEAEGYLSELRVGGIILFDVDLTGAKTIGSRNITSRQQLSRLTARIRSLADYPVIIAADQEGGRVQRLKPPYGYEALPAAYDVGRQADTAVTRHWGEVMAGQLAEAGVTLNLAPELDIHKDTCPVIGGLKRAYSASPDSVALHAGVTVDALHGRGIKCAVKHFPGHGSATSDSHYGLTDVTQGWTEDELRPFQALIDSGRADAVMTAHIFCRQLDPDYPATLSYPILTSLLREKMGYDGVIITDDMYMQGIVDTYQIMPAVERAILAGADMLIMGNNIATGWEPGRPWHVIDHIVEAVHAGRIPWQRLRDSAARVERLASRDNA